MAAADLTALAAAGAAAYVTWALPARGQPIGIYLELLPLLGLFVAGYARAGLYPGLGLGPVEMFRRLTLVTAFGFLVLAAFSFALKLPHLYSRITFAMAFVFSLVFVPLGRLALFRMARRWSWWAEPVVIIGTGRRAVRALRGITLESHLGYRPVAVLAAEGTGHPEESVEGVPIVGGLEHAGELSRSGIRVAFLEVEQMQTQAVLDRLQQDFQHVILLREFGDLPVEGLQVRNLGSLVGIEYTNNLLRPANQAAKRALDLVLGSVALLIALPLIVAAGLLVLFVDGRPILFHQTRAGLGGQRFKVAKIRTMRRDADQALEAHLSANPDSREEWAERHKLRDDPRLIPGIGRLFRRFSIDELPQIWAVLRGEMSLVGPRPFPDDHLAKFSPAFLELRQRVRPGITGVWQVTVRSDGRLEDQEALDTYYIRNWSVWFDLYVLCRTVGAVLSGRGAY